MLDKQLVKDFRNHLDSIVDYDTEKGFFKKVVELDNHTYEFYSYLLPSYDRFALHNCFYMRGILIIDGELLSPSMHKFFNLNENEKWMDTTLDEMMNSNDYSFFTKYDGSLIIPYLLDDKLYTRTKLSIDNDQIKLANSVLDSDSMVEIRERIIRELQHDIYPVYEVISPLNKIVVNYRYTELIRLGSYDLSNVYTIDDLVSALQSFTPDKNIIECKYNIKDIYDDIENRENFEGYVIQNRNSKKMYKVKMNKYKLAHGAKETITNPRKLLELICDESIDDLMNIIDDQYTKDYVDKIIVNTRNVISKAIGIIEKAIPDMKVLDRKDFAIKYRNDESVGVFFGLLMDLYIGKVTNDTEIIYDKIREIIKAKSKIFMDEIFNNVSMPNELNTFKD